MRKFTLVVFTLILFFATLLTVRFAWADWLRKHPDFSSITRSTELDPLNSLGFVAKARYEEQEGKDATTSWRRAILLDPRNPRILIQAGISAEMRGDISEAEKLYLQAEKTNALWLPRWTLANFYTRQNQPDKSLFWIKKGLDRAWGNDLSAVYDLALQSGATSEQILNELLPPIPIAYSGYMRWLVRDKLDAVNAPLLETAATRYIGLSGNWQAPRFSGPVVFAASHLMRNQYGDAAKKLWKRACNEQLIDCPTPPDDGLIANGAFLKAFIQSPLDWTFPPMEGITAIHQPGSGTVKYSFSGKQQEIFPLLTQTLNIPANTSWVVKFDFQTRDISPLQGESFAWQLGVQPIPLSRPLSSESWRELSFTIGPFEETTVAPLMLVYVRKPGTIRVKGDFWIRNIRAEKK